MKKPRVETFVEIPASRLKQASPYILYAIESKNTFTSLTVCKKLALSTAIETAVLVPGLKQASPDCQLITLAGVAC